MRSRAWFTLKGMSQQKWRWQEKSKSHNNYLFILKTETSKWFFPWLPVYSSHSNIFSVLITPFSQIIQVKVRQMLASFSGTVSYFFFSFSQREGERHDPGRGFVGRKKERARRKRRRREGWDTTGIVVLGVPRSAELSLWNETLPNTHKRIDLTDKHSLTHTHTQVATHCPILPLPWTQPAENC